MGKRKNVQNDFIGSKRSYARISLKRRKMLINMVIKQGFSIARAIKKLGLKLTTARFILQKYKETGAYPMKQFKKNIRMLRDLQDDSSSFVQEKNEEEESIKDVKIQQDQPIEIYQSKPQQLGMPIIWYYCFPYSFM